MRNAQETPVSGTWFPDDSEIGQLLRDSDAVHRALGAIETWPQSLRTLVGVCLASKLPMALAWGAARVLIYNDAYLSFCGLPHPTALGRDFKDCWRTLWPVIGGAFEQAQAGISTVVEEQRVLDRKAASLGPASCKYFFSPLRDDSGRIEGVLHLISETAPAPGADATRDGRVAKPAAREDDRTAEPVRLGGEDYFRRAIEHAPVPIIMYAEDGEVLQINQSWTDLTGYSLNHLAKLREWLAGVYGPGEETIRETAHRLSQHPGTVFGPVELVVAIRFGDIRRWLFSATAPGRLPDGRLYLIGVVEDITEHREAESRMRESEAHLHAILQQLPVAVGVVGRNGAWLLRNSLMNALAPKGIPWAFPAQREQWRAYDPDGNPLSPRDWPHQRWERGETTDNSEMLYTDGAGVERWMRVTLAPVRGIVGQPIGSACIIQDIDAIKRTQEALRASEHQLMLVANSVPALISYVDAECRYRWCNQTYRQWFGLESEQIVGRPMRETLGEKVWQAIEPAVREALAGQLSQVETEADFPQGGSRWIHATHTPHRDEQGNVVGVVGMVADITERKRTEQALLEMDRRKDEFIATLSHELRNPLAPLANSLHLLRAASGTDPSIVRVHDIMERQVNHLMRLVDDLLELSRISRGSLELRREKVKIVTIVRNACETVEPLIKAGRHRLQVSLPDEPLWVLADPVRLAQILANLLNNAARYSDPESEIWLTARCEDGAVVLSVRDNGMGIDQETLPRLFEMFSRGQRLSGRGQGGLGIGLALARTLAAMHGGTLEARSEGPGKGAEFTLRLPQSEAGRDEGEKSLSRSVDLARMHILVVDDNHDAAHSLAMLLGILGAEVKVAHSGAEALALLPAYDPACVLLDIGMPHMDGYEVARRIRAHYPTRRPALVALTGWGQETDRQRAREAGFDHHLIKPASIEDLQNVLGNLLTLTRGKQPAGQAASGGSGVSGP